MKAKSLNIIFLFGVLLFSISILLPFNFRNLAVIVLAIYFVISLTFPKSHKFFQIKTLAINTLFFIIMSSSMLYSYDIKYGLLRITSFLPLLIFALSFFFMINKNSIDYSKITNYLYLSFFLSTLGFFIAIFIESYHRGYINKMIFRDYPELINSNFGKYSIHPLYASIYVVISLILSIPLFSYFKRKFQRVLLLISILFLLIVLILLARKGPIIIVFATFLVYLISQKNSIKYLIYYFLAILTLIIIIYNIEPIKNRFLELVSVIFNFEQNNNGSTSMRLTIYDCSIDAIKESPLFGYGIGDVKDVLMPCYANKKVEYFNSHNQFLSAWLSAGILGFISLVLIFINSFKIAFRNKNFVALAIVSLFFIMSMTENILERQDGVLLFSFFINFFAFESQKREFNL